MSAPEGILDLVRKVKELAERGVAGEREAAMRKLDLLLKKHGLTLEDLASEEKVEIMVKIRGQVEEDLFLQVAAMITHSNRITYTGSRSKRFVWFKCTKVEGEDIQQAWAHYRRLYRQALRDIRRHEKALFDAFINRYHLSNPDADGSGSSSLSPEEMDRIMRLMRGLNGEAWAKPRAQIEG